MKRGTNRLDPQKKNKKKVLTKHKTCAIIKTLQGGARATAGSGDTSPSKTTQHLKRLVKHGATRKGRGASPWRKNPKRRKERHSVAKPARESPRDGDEKSLGVILLKKFALYMGLASGRPPMLFPCLLEQQDADRGQCKGRIFFEKNA